MIKRLLVNSNDDAYYEALVKRQMKNDKNHYSSRNSISIQIGSTVAVQQEDSGLWTHGTVVGKVDHNCHSRYDIVCATKTEWLITRNSKHANTTLITGEQFLWDQIYKNIRTDTVEDILKQFEIKKTEHNIMHMHNEQANKVATGNNNNDTQWDKHATK